MQKVERLFKTGAYISLICLGLAGCSTEAAIDQLEPGILPPVVNPITETNQTLRDLPPPSNQVVVAVYDYADQTGQFKPTEAAQTLSKAVTQGATSILIKALQDVGEGSWFTVVEREKIGNLLKERQIITQMRMAYLGEKKINPKALPPLLFAGIIFEGGIIGFDSNTQTGGVGARLLGIGGDVKYRLDTITIYLRAVSTKSGQVLASVTTHKTIASIGLQGGVFKYIALEKILEAEAGITKNEPEQLAVQQAIEKAVYSMVVEGAEKDIWSFADKREQDVLIERHRQGAEPPDRRALADIPAGGAEDIVVGSITPARQETPAENPPKPAKNVLSSEIADSPSPAAAGQWEVEVAELPPVPAVREKASRKPAPPLPIAPKRIPSPM
jgi:curli production assembly/transport component CsgG